MKTSRIPQTSTNAPTQPLRNRPAQDEKKSKIVILRYLVGKRVGGTIQPASIDTPSPITQRRRDQPNSSHSEPANSSKHKHTSKSSSKKSSTSSSHKSSSTKKSSTDSGREKNPPISDLEGHHLFLLLKAERDAEIAAGVPFKRDRNFWELLAGRLAKLGISGIKRSYDSLRMYWQRDGRIKEGYNEKTGQYEEGLTSTSTQGKKKKKNKGGNKRKREEMEEDE